MNPSRDIDMHNTDKDINPLLAIHGAARYPARRPGAHTGQACVSLVD